MRTLFFTCLFLFTLPLAAALAVYGDHDGPYGENDGIHGGNRLDPSAYPDQDPYITGWASEVVDYYRSSNTTFGAPENVLGQPGGTFDVFSLGDGGWITVAFDEPIANISGDDFAVWENGFVSRQSGEEGLLFAELMFVEVSTNGEDFIRFPSINLAPDRMGGFDCLDPTYFHNVAGKHPNGNDGRDEGTPFDLEDLADHPSVLDGTVDLEEINYVRLVDVVGDGSTVDSEGNPMYDPWPTPFGTGGADLDAIGALSASLPPSTPQPIFPENGAQDLELTPLFETDSYSDHDGDGHLTTRWQISTSEDWENLENYVFDNRSETQLTTLKIPHYILSEGQTYYWRVQFFDARGSESEWSATFSFATGELPANEAEDADEDGVPDAQQDLLITDIDFLGGDDRLQAGIKTLRTVVGDTHAGLKVSSDVEKIENFRSIDPLEIDDLGDKPADMPYGAIGFKLKVDTGATVNIDIFLDEEIDETLRWYKYTPVYGWQDYSEYTAIIPIGNGRTRIELSLVDGGHGDADGIENGWIVDPGGIGTPDTTSADSSISMEPDFRGPGECFIGSLMSKETGSLAGRIVRFLFQEL
jgi:hypothetical protein